MTHSNHQILYANIRKDSFFNNLFKSKNLLRFINNKNGEIMAQLKINLEDYKRKSKAKKNKSKKVGRFKIDKSLEEEFEKEYSKYQNEKEEKLKKKKS